MSLMNGVSCRLDEKNSEEWSYEIVDKVRIVQNNACSYNDICIETAGL